PPVCISAYAFFAHASVSTVFFNSAACPFVHNMNGRSTSFIAAPTLPAAQFKTIAAKTAPPTRIFVITHSKKEIPRITNAPHPHIIPKNPPPPTPSSETPSPICASPLNPNPADLIPRTSSLVSPLQNLLNSHALLPSPP